MAALAGTIIDNRVKATHKVRSHNNLLLMNECLAEHQSAYLIFAIGLATGSVAFRYDWARAIISIYIVAAIVFYVVGVSITADQDDSLAALHTCSGAKCNIRIPLRHRMQIIRANLVMTVVLLVVAVLLCMVTVKAPS